jgi:hypothetical protein
MYLYLCFWAIPFKSSLEIAQKFQYHSSVYWGWTYFFHCSLKLKLESSHFFNLPEPQNIIFQLLHTFKTVFEEASDKSWAS